MVAAGQRSHDEATRGGTRGEGEKEKCRKNGGQGSRYQGTGED